MRFVTRKLAIHTKLTVLTILSPIILIILTILITLRFVTRKLAIHTKLTAITIPTPIILIILTILITLRFVTPKALQSYIDAKFDKSIKTIQVLRDGFCNLWRAVIAKHAIHMRYGITVQTIDRHLDERSRPIEVTLAGGEVLECDHLIFAAPLW